MTDSPTENQTVQANPPAQQQTEAINTDQWQQFMQGMVAQNQALAAQLSNTQAAQAADNAQRYQAAVNALPDKERADALQNQLNAIRQFGEQAQRENLSQNVWQRRDAEAAARILMLHGMNGQEPELYKGDWDVNWMPRFVASVDHAVKGRQARNINQSVQTNPANRANVGNGTSSNMPELDDKASGYDTIRFALQKASRG